MLMCRQAPTAVCALCGAREDHHHALKSCPFLEGGIALARVSWSLRFNKHAWVGPSRICWDLPRLSLSTHVGLFMWAVLSPVGSIVATWFLGARIRTHPGCWLGCTLY